MYVVYANWTKDNIFLRKELDMWVEKYPDKVKVWYIVQESMTEN